METRFAGAVLSRREGDAWETNIFEGLDDPVAPPEIGATLALADVYDGLVFETLREP